MEKVRVTGSEVHRAEEVLTNEALDFLGELDERFADTRNELLARREARRLDVSSGGELGFLPETAHIRSADWVVAPAPADLRDRRVEITGPTQRKMTINALNSGARVWLADLEDANTPHWHNVIEGQVNLYDAARLQISLEGNGGSRYELKQDRRLATIMVRPRGWHLDEVNLSRLGRPLVGALVDFGLHFFHNAAELLARGSGPYFYLPKMESHLEARLWSDVFAFAERRLGIPAGSVRATVLIETIPAAFEMDEILYELKAYSAGLNAGRWDYLFSIIKYFRDSPDHVLPDRASVDMTAPFMKAYADLLVKTCHRRNAHAMGGMSAFIPSRRDEAVNAVAFAKVRQDKEREAAAAFDGSWVAHPDLVPICQEVFDRVLAGRENQLEQKRDDVHVTQRDLLDLKSAGGEITEQGLRSNIRVSVLYLESWLRGTGAVAIDNLMEDAATAEISRSQIWQWVANASRLSDKRVVTVELVRKLVGEELDAIAQAMGEELYASGEFSSARALFEEVALADEFADFLTLAAYETISRRRHRIEHFD